MKLYSPEVLARKDFHQFCHQLSFGKNLIKIFVLYMY